MKPHCINNYRYVAFHLTLVVPLFVFAEYKYMPVNNRMPDRSLSDRLQDRLGLDHAKLLITNALMTNEPVLYVSYKTFHPVALTRASKVAVPACELPREFKHGDHTATAAISGTTAMIPPPTPLFPGSPTRKAKSPDAS